MPQKQKVYCGMKQQLPLGYDRFAIPYQCLKKGYGACLYANRRGECRVRYEEQFFHRVENRMLFLLFLFCLFAMFLFFLYQFFS